MSAENKTLVRDASELTPSAFILSLPKAELHLHLEGAVEPATLVELSRRQGGRLEPAEVEALYRYPDFAAFLMAFKTVTDYLRAPEDYELITYRLMERLQQEKVVHAEVYISVGVVQWRGLEFGPIFEGLERGRARGEKDFGVSLLWIFDAVRHFGPEAAERVLDQALRYRERGVAGIGIGGDERRAAPEIFREVYARAREAGLRLTAHAGESAGPESVLGALDALGAERIGHGLNAWRDRELVERLKEQQVPLEICLTSNLRTACCKALEQHPLRRYFDQGLRVTLNSDDPAMFRTSLAREYALAQEAFGFTDQELRVLARNSFQASFLPEDRKRYYAQLAAGAVPQ